LGVRFVTYRVSDTYKHKEVAYVNLIERSLHS